jgi:hypothetical protein
MQGCDCGDETFAVGRFAVGPVAPRVEGVDVFLDRVEVFGKVLLALEQVVVRQFMACGL